MLVTQKKLELTAANAGYGEFWNGFVEDNDLARCDTCRMWGKFGEDVVGDGIDNYCDAHRPADPDDWKLHDHTDYAAQADYYDQIARERSEGAATMDTTPVTVSQVRHPVTDELLAFEIVANNGAVYYVTHLPHSDNLRLGPFPCDRDGTPCKRVMIGRLP